MALRFGTGDDQPRWPQGTQRLAGDEERRRRRATGVFAVGSLACPDCDAPVVVGRPVQPRTTIACAWCARQGPAREFLRVGAPTRPARVVLRVRVAV